MLTLNKIVQIVEEINTDLAEFDSDDIMFIQIVCANDIIQIEFFDIVLWNSQDDHRQEIYEDVYEDLDVFLRNKINDFAQLFVGVSI